MTRGVNAYLRGNYATALRQFKPLAEQGDAWAQYWLGRLYYRGEGVLKNYKTALKWYRLAAEQGFTDAQYQLGVMYHLGRGLPKNRVYSHMWYNIAALKGHKNSLRRRDLMATEMTPAQIDKSQDLAIECEKKKHKGC